MRCDNLLVAGLGQCGGILTDLAKDVNKRYSTVYINSSLGDIKGLKYADIDSNVFIYSGADGSGRDRSKADKFIKNDKLRLASFIKRYQQFGYMTVFTSFGGGTGAGSFKEFVKTVKKVLPHIVINLVAVLPSLEEDKLQLENALDSCADLEDILGLINDFKFIDNNKGKSYNTINEEAITSLDKSYRMTGHDEIGSIDEDNLTRVTTAKGYGVILELPRRYSSIEEAITTAQQNSVFAIPESLECTYAAVNVTDEYKISDIQTLLEVDETMYKTHNRKLNMIALGGCDLPTDIIADIEDELKSRESKKRERKTGFNLRSARVSEKIEETTPARRTFDDEEDLDDLFDDSDFR